MNILFYITTYPGYGGIEKVTTYLANYLSTQSHHVHILSFKNKCDNLRSQLSENVQLDFVPDNTNFLSEENRVFLSEYLGKYDFNRIIYQDCYSPIHELLFLIDYPVKEKLIIVEHNSPLCYLIAYKNYWENLSWFSIHDFPRKLLYFYKKQRIKAKLSNRHCLLLENCYTYVLLSNRFKEDIHWMAGNRFDSKITSIPNPVTIPINRNKEISKKKQVLFVGRLVQDKGINFIIQIWEKIERKYSDWELLIVGDGDLRPYLEQAIKIRQLKNIRMLGAKLDVVPYYQQASILIMTSIFEGFPLVLFEAMSSGCVPIAFNSFKSLPDIIDNGVNGFQIAPFNIDYFKKQMELLIKDTSLCHQMGIAAKEKSKKYELNTIGKLWDILLKE